MSVILPEEIVEKIISYLPLRIGIVNFKYTCCVDQIKTIVKKYIEIEGRFIFYKYILDDNRYKKRIEREAHNWNKIDLNI